MSTADNFDALLGSFKEQVIKACEQGGDRDMIYTDDRSVYGGKICTWEGDADGSTLYITTHSSTIRINCQPDALRALAAQCLAAAEEVEEALEEAQAVRPNMHTYEPLERLTIRSTK